MFEHNKEQDIEYKRISDKLEYIKKHIIADYVRNGYSEKDAEAIFNDARVILGLCGINGASMKSSIFIEGLRAAANLLDTYYGSKEPDEKK